MVIVMTRELKLVEFLIDNLWYYESVVSPKPSKTPSHDDDQEISEEKPRKSLLCDGEEENLQDQSNLPLAVINCNRSISSLDPFHSDHLQTFPLTEVTKCNQSISNLGSRDTNNNGVSLSIDDLSPQMLDLHRVFDIIDSNHNGKVTRNDLCAWMKNLGLANFIEEDILHIVAKAHIDVNGSLDFSDFVSLNKAIDSGQIKDDQDGYNEDSEFDMEYPSGDENEAKNDKILDLICVHGVVSNIIGEQLCIEDGVDCAHIESHLDGGVEGKGGKELFEVHAHEIHYDDINAKRHDEENGENDQLSREWCTHVSHPGDIQLLHTLMLREVFELFDKDHNGLISPKELSIALENLGILTGSNDHKSMYDDIIKRVDLDGDGQVNFPEFQKMMDLRPIDCSPSSEK